VGRTIIAALISASSAFLIAACTTTPEETQTAASETRTASEVKPGAQPRGPGRNPTEIKSSNRAAAVAPQHPGDTLGKRSIYYDYDRFEIKDEYRGIVEAHAKHLRENPNAKMVIQGHADERGSREYNIALGQRRSENVKKMLLLLGARESQVESVSLGEEKPVCTDTAEDCWWKNRRGEIRYAGEY
jgi:peptidoglycan-associated lipoprotein